MFFSWFNKSFSANITLFSVNSVCCMNNKYLETDNMLCVQSQIQGQ